MPSDGRLSNIRVFIQWEDQTVFAGEEIRCRITFKNIAPASNQPPTSASIQHSHPSSPRVDHPRLQPSPALSPREKAVNGLAPPASARGHRSTLSLNIPNSALSASRSKGVTTPQWTPPQPPPQRPGHAHKRSLSIVSLASSTTAEDPTHGSSSPSRQSRPGTARSHGRSASLQIAPRGGTGNGPQSASLPRRAPVGLESSPVFNNHSFPPARPSTSRSSASATAPNTPSYQRPSTSRKSPGFMPEFRFPMAPAPSSAAPTAARANETPISPMSEASDAVTLSAHPKETIPSIAHPAPAARILSTASIAEGTPRSSGEFYSMSNHSTETLASEYPMQALLNGRRPTYFRRSSAMSGIHQARMPETLMMGYAQVQGSFTLDGSLINLGPFEAVKRKAVLGGQGGGVIGVETSRKSNGLLTGFGWGNISNSIGELLGGGELSSIKDMRGVASSKSVPLLSTPQSILFVDLQLAPGDSKTYEYAFKLPKGLPPSHRGKAMKISYSLVIGTQRPGGTKEQQVRSVDIPFRVLGSVNSHGEILGHDLLSPYIILRDQANVLVCDKTSATAVSKRKDIPDRTGSTINDFVRYVDELLDSRHRGSGLLSPTATAPQSRRDSMYEEVAATAKEAIDLAIIRSNLSSETGQSTNRFEIARNGQRVGVIMLARPAYRLGEAVSMAIDFTGADVPCYAVHAVLETSERVDGTLALRSEASVHRVTRKVYGSSSEATLYARRVVFNPTIPINATPEFITSGVSLEWKVRIEFVVPSSASSAVSNSIAEDTEDSASSSQHQGDPHPLLEEISRDDRGGLVLVAAENLECESFEVAVPLRVYGAVCNGLERLERDEALEEGLVV
ncbi:Rgp1-domain-containing protein [Xylariomycetidae sp. FL0641]|nr:Rgp1-domain-containing protein [Xylariomycetidae sp. FL0641]